MDHRAYAVARDLLAEVEAIAPQLGPQARLGVALFLVRYVHTGRV